ncbi:hypothetical protein ACH5RR_039278 [Cinchona calisaya]|uniref:Uncharacterized protein n=1 Tax=Cinchona calisaya TaxID=153742 RepID=A0ABD2Y309_9GENT
MGKNPGELTGYAETVDFHEEPTLATSHQRDKEETDTSPAKQGSELRTTSISSSLTLPEMDNRSSIPTRRGPDQGNSKLAPTKCTLGLLTIMSCNNMLKDGHNLKLDEGMRIPTHPDDSRTCDLIHYNGPTLAFRVNQCTPMHQRESRCPLDPSPARHQWKQASPLCWLGEEGISIAKDSIQPQVPPRLPCYDFTPVEDPTMVFAHCPDSPLLPPVGVRPCLSPSVADHPKRPAKHHWLGQPLPDQLPYPTQAHQTALFSFLQDLARTVQQIPTRYAPVRHFVLNSSHLLGKTSYL